MKKINDIEPTDKSSYAYFEWLKRENIRQLRKAKHKAHGLGREPRQRTRFAKPDDTKQRTITGKSYVEWMDDHGKTIEPLEANPDLWEDDQYNTVD